jgi:hypothetical protein
MCQGVFHCLVWFGKLNTGFCSLQVALPVALKICEIARVCRHCSTVALNFPYIPPLHIGRADFRACPANAGSAKGRIGGRETLPKPPISKIFKGFQGLNFPPFQRMVPQRSGSCEFVKFVSPAVKKTLCSLCLLVAILRSRLQRVRGLTSRPYLRFFCPHLFAEAFKIRRRMASGFAFSFYHPRCAKLHPCFVRLERLGCARMFDTISAELITAKDKLAHLRRFL